MAPVAEATEDVAITRLDRLPDGIRRALEAAAVRVLEFPAEDSGSPALALAGQDRGQFRQPGLSHIYAAKGVPQNGNGCEVDRKRQSS